MPRRALIDRFLELRHLAFVGVSRRPEEFANTVYRRLRQDRTMYPVNVMAGGATIEGDRAYSSLAEVPEPLDGVLVMVPPAELNGVLAAIAARRVPMVWIHRGLGQPPVPTEAVVALNALGIEVVDGACPLMFLEPVRGFHRLHRAIARRHIAA